MDWIDVSVPIGEGMVTFEGDPIVRVELVSAMSRGDSCNVSRLEFGAHTGTHIDAPVHFIEGASGIDSTSIDVLVGPALVVDATAMLGTITADDLARLDLPVGETRLLFKTANSRLWDEAGFVRDFVALDEAAARALVERGARLVGADYLSIAPFDDPAPTHRALLEAGVVIVEGLDLRSIAPGPYDFICLPLRLVDGDGAPARAILRPRS